MANLISHFCYFVISGNAQFQQLSENQN